MNGTLMSDACSVGIMDHAKYSADSKLHGCDSAKILRAKLVLWEVACLQ